jgi:hypothetical protein
MARVDLIECDNCAAEFSASPEARASMTQLVITQGGSRSHVYDLCPTCSGGLTQKLPDNLVDWPRFVSREAVQQWLRTRQGGNPWDDPARREEAKRQGVETAFDTVRGAMEQADAKARREAEGNFDHVRRPTEYGDG